MNKLKCPYCGTKASYSGIWNAKDNTFYKCKHCQNESVLILSRTLKNIAIGLSIISVLFAVLYIFFGNEESLLGVGIVVLMFTIFYLLIPTFSILHKTENFKNYKKNQS